MLKNELTKLATEIEKLPIYDAGLTRRAFDLVAAELPAADRQMVEGGGAGLGGCGCIAY